MFIGNIVNIVQHSHLYNSFLLIIVACIVILLVELYYIGIMLASASSLHFHQSTSWNGQSSLATYGNETKLGQKYY